MNLGIDADLANATENGKVFAKLGAQARAVAAFVSLITIPAKKHEVPAETFVLNDTSEASAGWIDEPLAEAGTGPRVPVGTGGFTGPPPV